MDSLMIGRQVILRIGEKEMADNEERTPITLELVKTEAVVPAPDSLAAAPNGITYAEPIKIEVEGEFKRGTVFMRASDGANFIAATAAGLATAKEIVILCDDITVGENEYTECVANRVILPYESESDSHEELIEAIKPLLRPHGIYLRSENN